MLATDNEQQTQSYPGTYNIYKGRKTGDGAASSWRLSLKGDKPALFVELAKQTGELDANDNATFDWKRYDRETKQQSDSASVVAKLGLPDISEMILVLDGVNKKAGKDGKGFYHKNAKGSTTINFESWEKDGVQLGFTVRVASKVGNGDGFSVSHAINFAEAVVLRILLQNSVLQLCRW